VLALALDFWPNLYLPAAGPDQEARKIETKLGLDLQGGLKVEYRVDPAGGKVPGPADVEVVKQIIERRVNATGVSEPVCHEYLSGLDYGLSYEHLAGLTEFFRRLVAAGRVPNGTLAFLPAA